MKPNTHIRLHDGREGTVVYHNLDGYGIVWGRHEFDVNDLPPPQAMLRDYWPTAELECVGRDYEAIKETVPA